MRAISKFFAIIALWLICTLALRSCGQPPLTYEQHEAEKRCVDAGGLVEHDVTTWSCSYKASRINCQMTQRNK